MKRVASAAERDMVGWGIGGCWVMLEVQGCTVVERCPRFDVV